LLTKVVQALPPLADLRAAMQAERERLQASGWVVDNIPRNYAFFFCERDNDRVCVSIEGTTTREGNEVKSIGLAGLQRRYACNSVSRCLPVPMPFAFQDGNSFFT
jgi:hypothetical protein